MGNVQKHETILLKELNMRKVLSIDSAVQLLGVSESTVRRLFASMEDKGVCVRNSGCIKLLNNDITNIYVYEHMDSTNVSEKTAIAQSDISKLENGNSNPTLDVLKRLAEGMNMTIKLEFVPKQIN